MTSFLFKLERKQIMLKLKTEQIQDIWQVSLYDIFEECEKRTLIPVGITDEEETLLFAFANCVQVFGEPVKKDLILGNLIANAKQERAKNVLDNESEIFQLKQQADNIESNINKNINADNVDIFESLEDMVQLNITLQLLDEKLDRKYGAVA